MDELTTRALLQAERRAILKDLEDEARLSALHNADGEWCLPLENLYGAIEKRMAL